MIVLNVIFGVIKRIFRLIFKCIYAVIKFFHLQLAVLVGAAGGVMYLLGVFDEDQTLLIVFYVALGLSAILAVFLTVRKLFGYSGKNKKKQDSGAK